MILRFKVNIKFSCGIGGIRILISCEFLVCRMGYHPSQLCHCFDKNKGKQEVPVSLSSVEISMRVHVATVRKSSHLQLNGFYVLSIFFRSRFGCSLIRYIPAVRIGNIKFQHGIKHPTSGLYRNTLLPNYLPARHSLPSAKMIQYNVPTVIRFVWVTSFDGSNVPRLLTPRPNRTVLLCQHTNVIQLHTVF